MDDYELLTHQMRDALDHASGAYRQMNDSRMQNDQEGFNTARAEWIAANNLFANLVHRRDEIIRSFLEE